MGFMLLELRKALSLCSWSTTPLKRSLSPRSPMSLIYSSRWTSEAAALGRGLVFPCGGARSSGDLLPRTALRGSILLVCSPFVVLRSCCMSWFREEPSFEAVIWFALDLRRCPVGMGTRLFTTGLWDFGCKERTRLACCLEPAPAADRSGLLGSSALRGLCEAIGSAVATGSGGWSWNSSVL
jgi:hypothetical protein